MFDAQRVEFGCTCSPDKVRQSLLIYSARDIATMTTDEGIVTADCQFCGAHYELDLRRWALRRVKALRVPPAETPGETPEELPGDTPGEGPDTPEESPARARTNCPRKGRTNTRRRPGGSPARGKAWLTRSTG